MKQKHCGSIKRVLIGRNGCILLLLFSFRLFFVARASARRPEDFRNSFPNMLSDPFTPYEAGGVAACPPTPNLSG